MDIKKIKRSITLQQDASGCGVACLLSLIQYYGGESSLEKLRELTGTSVQGSTLLGLYQAANQLGFNAQGCEANIASLIDHNKPVIMHVLIDQKLEHYIICYGYENEKFVITDPSKGLLYYTKDELENIWVSHTCLILSVNDQFIKKNDIVSTKKKWITNLLQEDFGLLGSSVFLGLIISILGMTTAIFSQKLIDTILPEKDFRRLWVGIIFVGVLLLARVGISALRQFVLFSQSKEFNNRIISFFYKKLLNLPKSFFDTRKIGDLVARLNDTRRIQQVISTIVGTIVIDGLTTIVIVIFLFLYSWEIAVIILGCLPLFVYIIYRNNTPLIDAQKEVMAGYANSETNFINTMQGIDTIKNFNQQSHFEKLNQQIYGFFQDKIFSLGKINIKLSVYSGVISVILTILTIAVGSLFVLRGTLSLGELIAIISLVGTITPAIVNLSLVPIPLNEAKVAFNRMFDVTYLSPENREGKSPFSTIEIIKIQNVSFRFAGRKPILNNISMELLKGKMTFLIGESGSGKSTLCKILEKFYTQESGNIILNDSIGFESIGTDYWRDILGVIPQEIFIFNGTIIENICINTNQEHIQQAIEICEKYGLENYFKQMPQGYMTIVGENGINLSGGEKQLIALARILVKNPKILLLDEPTAAMDRKMEKQTLDILKSIKENRIIFFISHRLHILKNYADFIYLLENNSISHAGTHLQLLQSENLYSAYWADLL